MLFLNRYLVTYVDLERAEFFISWPSITSNNNVFLWKPDPVAVADQENDANINLLKENAQ